MRQPRGPISRRTVLKLMGATGASAAVTQGAAHEALSIRLDTTQRRIEGQPLHFVPAVVDRIS